MHRNSLLVLPLLAWACGSTPDHSGHHEPAPSLEALLQTPDFELVNTEGRAIRSDELHGKVWLVNFIFTRCTGPCPLMTQRMKGVQDALRDEGLVSTDSPVRLVSISVDPAYDTPEVLARYAESWHVDPANWDFLTGPPEETLQLIREGFKITATHEGSGTDAIVHSTSFLLVDRTGSVRRIVRLDDPDFVAGILDDVRKLVEEPAHVH